jgi:hypothetical protein
MQTEARFNYFLGILFFVAFILLDLALWRLFFAPTHGVMKLFTPMYGLSIVAVLLGCILCLTDIFNFTNSQGKTLRGLALTVGSQAAFYLNYYGFFWNFLGKYGVAYFSPQSIIDAGGTGAEIWNARESASTAVTYLATAFIFVAMLWRHGLEKFPWNEGTRAVVGWSRFFAVSFFAVILYAVLFHPHVTALFVPKQSFAGVEPWWEGVAMTSSAFYHLGWMLMSVAVLALFAETCNGWPLTSLPTTGSKALFRLAATLVLSVGLGFVLFYLLEMAMTHFWDEPFLGGSYTDDPRFRHLHVGEIAVFAIAASYLWQTYFGNWPTRLPTPVGHAVRLAIVVLLTGGFWLFYYNQSIGPKFVDRVPGIGNIDDTALCWGLMTVMILMVPRKFFGGWPMRRPEVGR